MTKKLNKVNKPKLFKDYSEEVRKTKTLSKYVDYFQAVELEALYFMLDGLAQKNFDLEKDNDLLRGQITELTHKMDFVMENARSSEHYHLTDDLIKQGFSSLPMTLSDHYELTKGPSLMERMKEEGEKLEKSLKKKKKGVK